MTAMITVTIENVLLETDVPDLVLARDAIGTAYLCAFVEREAAGDRFAAVPLSPERLAGFRAGLIDLREVLERPETGLAFDARFRRMDGLPTLQLQQVERIPNDWLPDAGFLLSAFAGPVENVAIVQHATERRVAVVECHFEPPEARTPTPRIEAFRLAHGIEKFQTLLMHAYKKARAAMTPLRRLQMNPDAYILQAYAVSLQSFCVHFESKYEADLAGATSVGLAMRTFDELMDVLARPEEERMAVLREHRGHVVGAFRNLMKFVSEEDSPLVYTWAEPASRFPQTRRVGRFDAAAMCAVLEALAELGVERVEFVGVFIRVSTDLQKWTAQDDEGAVRSGVVHEDAQNVLRGTVNENKRYKFLCDEKLLEKATGQQVLRLFLRDLEPVV